MSTSRCSLPPDTLETTIPFPAGPAETAHSVFELPIRNIGIEPGKKTKTTLLNNRITNSRLVFWLPFGNEPTSPATDKIVSFRWKSQQCNKLQTLGKFSGIDRAGDIFMWQSFWFLIQSLGLSKISKVRVTGTNNLSLSTNSIEGYGYQFLG